MRTKPALAVLLGLLLGAVACQSAAPVPPLSVSTSAPLSAPLATTAPARPGRVAWQAAIGRYPVIAGGAIVGMGVNGVQEFDSRTGAPRWSWTDGKQPRTLELLVADNTVFAVVGHDIGHAPAMVAPIAAELDALDLPSGKLLWSHPIAGNTQSPGLAASRSVVALADNSAPGRVAGLDPRTGVRVWNESAPSGCAMSAGQALVQDTYLTGGGNDLAVGRRCDPLSQGTASIQGLDPATGTPRWTTSADMGNSQFGIFLNPANSGILVAAVQVSTGTPTQTWSVPEPNALSTQLAAFDMTTGAPVWQESGMDNLASAQGDANTVCITDDAGYECRHLTTGALILSSAAPPPSGPYGDSGPVTLADGFVYELEQQGGKTTIVVRSSATGAVTATEPVHIGQTAAEGSAYTNGLVAAGYGLVLVRRVDDAGWPALGMNG